MQILINSRWEYEGKTYRVERLTNVKWSDGQWYPAVTYWPEIHVPNAPNEYTRRQDDFLAKFKEK